MVTNDDGTHGPTLVYFEGRHSIPAEVCGTCSDERAGRWVPVTECPQAATQMGEPGDRDYLFRVVHRPERVELAG
jgi:hypothetical protein